MFSKILVPYARGTTAEPAWQCSVDLARKYEAELHLLGVVDPTLVRTQVEVEIERRHLLRALRELAGFRRAMD